MAILTADEAKAALGYNLEEDMPRRVEFVLLPAIDRFLQGATGKDWGTLTETYTTVDPVAKAAASVLLVRWFDDPGQIGQANDAGILALIGQMEARALQEAQAMTG